MNITVKRINSSLFGYDIYHKHKVFLDGIEIGQAERVRDVWILTLSVFKVSFKLGSGASTYDRISSGIVASLNTVNNGTEIERKSIMIIEGAEYAQPDKDPKRRPSRQVLHIPTGIVYESAVLAAEATGVNDGTLRAWLSGGKYKHIYKYN